MNKRQKVVLSSALREVENMLEKLEILGSVTSRREGIFYTLGDSIPQTKKEKMLFKVDEFKRLLVLFKKKFQLEKEEENARNKCHSQLTGMWTLLEDIKAKGLMGYGVISTDEKEILDDSLNSLIQRIFEMKKLIQC